MPEPSKKLPGDLAVARKSKIIQEFRDLRLKLGQILNKSPEDISPSHLLVTLIPADDRRRVWEQLRESGVVLPDLRLANPVIFVIALIVLLPVTVLAILSKNRLLFLCLFEFFWIAGKLTRTWAIFPPIGCETVQEAVLCTTSFHQSDFRAGLWPRQDIAAKVRWIFSERLGIPFGDITDESKIADFC
jgi:hypothetical protein